MNAIKQGFFSIAQFPNVLGVIDASQISVKAPSTDEQIYMNRKFFNSIIVQGICNSDLIFTSIFAKWPGSTHDSFIWNTCDLKVQFENGDFGNGYLLGDSGYALQICLLTFIMKDSLSSSERKYNKALKQTR